jgi:hypothetical protein
MGGNIFRQISSIAVFKEDIEIGLGLFNINEVYDMITFTMIKKSDLSLK